MRAGSGAQGVWGGAGPESRTRLENAVHLLLRQIPLPCPRALLQVSTGAVMAPPHRPPYPQGSPHHVDTFWLLGEAVGIAAGRGSEVNGHHHQKRLLLRDVRVSIILRTSGVKHEGWAGEAEPGLPLCPGVHPLQTEPWLKCATK